jgi:hypothetical protein
VDVTSLSKKLEESVQQAAHELMQLPKRTGRRIVRRGEQMPKHVSAGYSN